MNTRSLVSAAVSTAFGAVLTFSGAAAAAFTIDGNLNDWGINHTTWAPSAGIHATVEDQTGSGSFFLAPGWGGQAYDAEALYAQILGNTLYIALATGHNPTTAQNPGANSYGAGDFAIDFGKNGSYEVGINVITGGFGVAGGVYGGATDLALCCDFRIGDTTAQMFMPAARLGLHYYESGMVRYVSRLGVNAAKMLFLTARRIQAEEMFRIGYLTTLCRAGELDAAVDDLVKDLSAMAPLAVAGMKRAINEIARDELDSAAFAERARQCFQSEDIKEGLRAFHEKRAPRFSGR